MAWSVAWALLAHDMTQRRSKNAFVVLAGLILASLGVYNIVLKATWTLMDDGVFWDAAPQGLVAARIAPGGPAARAGVQAGDILIAVDEHEVLTRADLEAELGAHRSGDEVKYSLLRADERRTIDLPVQPAARGATSPPSTTCPWWASSAWSWARW